MYVTNANGDEIVILTEKETIIEAMATTELNKTVNNFLASFRLMSMILLNNLLLLLTLHRIKQLSVLFSVGE